jgi:nucleoside-diphosphate-sugar epimerase
LESKKVLLIGGAGYIGTVISQYLLNKNYEVTCADNFIYNVSDQIIPFFDNKNYQFKFFDFSKKKSIDELIKDKDYIVFLGGLVGDPITKKYQDLSQSINFDGIEDFIKKMSNSFKGRFIFISTCSNYGLIPENDLADENYPLSPLSHYAKCKVLIEELILSMKGKVNFTATILRFATAFGVSPRMRFDLTVNEFTKGIFLGDSLEVYDPDTWRPYCHTKDFARIIELVFESDIDNTYFEVFNAGSNENNYTKRMIVEEITKHIKNEKITFLDKGNDPRNYKVDFSKIKKLGFSPEKNISKGIEELVFRLKQNFFRTKFSVNSYGNYEIEKK